MKNSIIKSTGIVALSTLASRVLGFLRDMLMASYFGASGATDAFFVAFKIPNMFRRFVAEGALTVSFIPVYTDYLINKGERDALELAQKTFTALLILLFGIITLGEIFSPEIVRLFAYGFDDPVKISLTVDLTRIMFPYLFFVSLVAFSMGILNSHGYFFAPSFAPVLLNVGMIAGIVYFSAFFNKPLYGVGVGVLLGGVIQVILQVPYLVRSGFRLKISVDFKHPGIRKIFIMIGPLLFAMAIYQINILLGIVLASSLKEGSISYIYYSDRLIELVLGVFIVSIANVILPEMSRLTSTYNMDKLKKIYISSIQGALFLAIPATVALMAVGFPIISVFFMRNKFTAVDVNMTYMALFYAAIGISSISIIRITTPAFYSLKNTIVPVISGVINLVIFISLGYVLMHTKLAHAGITLANSISLTVQMLILLIVLRLKIGRLNLRGLLKSVCKYITASIIMMLVITYISGFVDWVSDGIVKRLVYLVMIVISGGTVYFIACFAMKADEVVYLVKRIRSILNIS